jgi:hypothetical protein
MSLTVDQLEALRVQRGEDETTGPLPGVWARRRAGAELEGPDEVVGQHDQLLPQAVGGPSVVGSAGITRSGPTRRSTTRARPNSGLRN